MRRHRDQQGKSKPGAGALLSLVLAATALAAAGAAPARAQEPVEDFAYDQVETRVALWLDRDADEVYNKGDEMQVGFQTNRDAYAVVYRIDAEGLVTVLWPRTPLDDGFVFGGHEYRLPVAGGRPLNVGTVEGEGYVEALVSRYPFDLRQLELDFHHRQGEQRYDFRVAGDPFLAMNEINYTITGLEDPQEYVVTNYAAYYVHRQVDHPRYLCSQCHVDEPVANDPYGDQCTLNITVDYTWSNRWWDRYGYYPVYVNPVWVYVDPWTWRPWVNFWYDPWWRAPSVWVCDWYRPVYCWWDSPRYRGNCNVWYDRHPGGYRPLAPPPPDGTRTKLREYGRVTAMVDDGTRTKTLRETPRGKENAYRGERAERRVQPRVDKDVRRRNPAGLQIHRGGSAAGGGERTALRHTAGGGDKAPQTARVKPVTRSTERARGADQRVARPDATERTRSREVRGGTIRTVEPRQRGSRIWHSERATKGGARQRRETVRPSNPRTRGGTAPARRESGSVRQDRGTGSPRRSADDGGTKVRGSRSDGGKQQRSVSGSRGSSGGARTKGTTRGGGGQSSGSSRTRGGGGSSKSSRR